MNERIRELAEQCREEYPDTEWPDATRYRFDEAKFAELIVRECIKLSQPQVEYPVDGTWIEKSYWEGCYDSSNRIKEHFGVE